MVEFRIPVETTDPSGKQQILITYTKIFCYVICMNKIEHF